jgi:hypothetical protein
MSTHSNTVGTPMELLSHQQNMDALRDLAWTGVDLLATGQFELLVERYGYATALGRNPADAVRMDLARALSEVSGDELLQMKSNDLPVLFYEDNHARLRAAIDCEVPTQAGRSVWISFVVTGAETDQFLTLEDICARPEPDCRG